MKKGKILIIGGTGAFGAFYSSRLKEEGYEIFVSSRNAEKGKAFCKKKGYSFFEGKNPKGFDIVILSVPNSVAPQKVKEVGKSLEKGTLLMDFCSVKTKVVEEMEKLKGKGVELASVHPMHGPRVKSVAGYPVVCVPINKGKKLEEMKGFFEKRGANFFYSDAKEHDKILSIVQGLTHYTQFVSGAVLDELEVDLKRSMQFSSPNYIVFLSLISRVLLQNPEMYSQIQLENPYNGRVRRVFSKKAEELEEMCRKSEQKKLERRIIESGKEYKEPDLFLFESDRIVAAVKHVVNTLKAYKGQMFLVENVVSHKYHYGIIKEITNRKAVIEEQNKPTKISVSKIRLPTKKEVKAWKKKNLKEKHLDYSFLVPEEVKRNAIGCCFSSIKNTEFEIIDEYTGKGIPKGEKSFTIRVKFFEGEDCSKIDSSTKEIISGLGFTLR